MRIALGGEIVEPDLRPAVLVGQRDRRRLAHPVREHCRCIGSQRYDAASRRWWIARPVRTIEAQVDRRSERTAWPVEYRMSNLPPPPPPPPGGRGPAAARPKRPDQNGTPADAARVGRAGRSRCCSLRSCSFASLVPPRAGRATSGDKITYSEFMALVERRRGQVASRSTTAPARSPASSIDGDEVHHHRRRRAWPQRGRRGAAQREGRRPRVQASRVQLAARTGPACCCRSC